jgi:hypothetical protein
MRVENIMITMKGNRIHGVLQKNRLMQAWVT